MEEEILKKSCASCGTEIPAEQEFCAACLVELNPCPLCGQVICVCETGVGD